MRGTGWDVVLIFSWREFYFNGLLILSLTLLASRTIITSIHSPRGVSGDRPEAEWMRRLRAGLVTPHSGGVGAPPGWPLRAACQELADDPGKVRTKARPDAETRTPQWSAERRASRSQGMRRRKAEVGAPLGAPLPSLSRGKSKGRRTRRLQTIRVAERWLERSGFQLVQTSS
jgi:hypothetical protein